MRSQLQYKKKSNFRQDGDDSHFLIYHPRRHLLSLSYIHTILGLELVSLAVPWSLLLCPSTPLTCCHHTLTSIKLVAIIFDCYDIILLITGTVGVAIENANSVVVAGLFCHHYSPTSCSTAIAATSSTFLPPPFVVFSALLPPSSPLSHALFGCQFRHHVIPFL